MFGGVVILVVDAEHESYIFPFCGGGNDNFFRAATVDVGARFRSIGKESGRLDDEIDAQIFPRYIRRIALR